MWRSAGSPGDPDMHHALNHAGRDRQAVDEGATVDPG
jgi:hypothetical protein